MQPPATTAFLAIENETDKAAQDNLVKAMNFHRLTSTSQ